MTRRLQPGRLARFFGTLAVAALLGCGVSTSGPATDDESGRWLRSARVAWRYYETSWDPTTGLPYATSTWPYFTDWDLGGYLLTILAAEELEVLHTSGPAGADARIDKVLAFLETRPLARGVPYRFYSARWARPYDPQPKQRMADPSDVGRLLIALDAVRNSRSALEPRIRVILARERLYEIAASPYFGGLDLYAWYAAQGFKLWGYETPALHPPETLAERGTVEVYGERLPSLYITSEPVLHALLELDEVDSAYRALADRIYRVQVARHQRTGVWTAWSEGHYPGRAGYMFEWIVTEDGRSWIVLDVLNQQIDGFEIAYAKVAFAFLPLYDSDYARDLVARMEGLATPGGFQEGLAAGKPVDAITDKTNGLILEAAVKALRPSALQRFGRAIGLSRR